MPVQTKPPREPEVPAKESGSTVAAVPVLNRHSSAWASQPHEPGTRPAPGAPGDEPRWTTAAKEGVGTALGSGIGGTSLVWFTVGEGILTEIFHPRIDRACTRDLALLVTDGARFFSDERIDTEHQIETPIDGVPLYRLINTCRQGRYRIEKTVFAHPHQDAVLQVTRFEALKGNISDYHLYVLLAPHLGNKGSGNTAWLGAHLGVPMLFARRHDQSLALAGSAPWTAGSVGYVGRSDGWQDLQQHKRLTWDYDLAENGNVALTAEVDLGACGGAFTLVVGCGRTPAEAGHRALSSVLDEPSALQAEYVRDWRNWQDTLTPPPPAGGSGGRDLFRISAAVLQSHHARSIPGAIIASLSTPWGTTRGDEERERGTGGYHLVWPRDMIESAGGLLAAGARQQALYALAYLRASQMADGHWPQNMWVSTARYWTGIQIGETAFPVLLLDLLRRDGALPAADLARYWPMVRRAVGYIVGNGPSTQQDRWENQRGYTPFTVSLAIAALLVAGELADSQGEPDAGAYLRETADAWNTAIESWLYVKDTALAHRLGIDGYYARSIPPEADEGAPPRLGHVMLKGSPTGDRGVPAADVVSPDALSFVRFGLRTPDDPRIVATVKAIDALLKVDTPYGPVWRRYNGDGYGEMPDGSPYVLGGERGVGRAWPLLTGERAHYELAAGRRDEAIRLLHAMESFASASGMIPEQVWDAADIPDRHLFLGRPSGSAMPLAWAHAEYLKLRRSIQEGGVFDTPPQTVQRYLKDKVVSDRVIWRFDHQPTEIFTGDVLRVEVRSPAVIHWSCDGWKTTRDELTRDTGLGIHVADLPTKKLHGGETIAFTFHWRQAGRWEGKNFAVTVARAPGSR